MRSVSRRRAVLALAVFVVSVASCFELFSTQTRPNPDNCVANPELCQTPLSCNQYTGRCDSPVSIACNQQTNACPSPFVCDAKTGTCRDPLCLADLGATGSANAENLNCPVAFDDLGVDFGADMTAGDMLIRGPSFAWAVGDLGTILKWGNNRWSLDQSNVGKPLRGIWGSSPSNVWAVGWASTTTRYDGNMWSSGSVTNMAINTAAGGADLLAIWGSAAADFWVVGSGSTVINFNVSANKPPVPLMATYNGVYGNNASDVYIVGSGGVILRWDGSVLNPTSTNIGAVDLFGVWSSSVSSIWVVGFGGLIAQSGGSGSMFMMQNSMTTSTLRSVWGGSATSQRAVGTASAVQLGSGATTWSTENTGVTGVWNAVWGSAPNDIWIVGKGGLIMHFDGVSYRQVPSPTTNDLYGVFGFP